MKEAFVDDSINVTIRDVPIPQPALGEVLIKIVVSGTNPKDWKLPEWMYKGKPAHNSGDDIAGIVEAVGEGVKGFKKGDRVAAFHEMMAEHGSFAEYGIAWEWCTFHIPDSTSFEEAATIPLAGMTAALGLYQRLGLPPPFRPATEPIPLVIYGGSSAVGAFAIKLAKASNIHPIIAIAGRACSFVEDLIDKDKGDVVLDYRIGDDALVAKIKETLGGMKLFFAYDAISEGSSIPNISQVIESLGTITTVLPTPEASNGAILMRTNVGSSYDPRLPFAKGAEGVRQPGDREFAGAFYPFLSLGLAHGWFTPHPYQVVEGGLGGLEKALRDLKANKTSAFKYVLRIKDTEGAGKE